METKPSHKILTKLQGYIITVLLISVLMTAVMSFGMILVKVKSHENLLSLWWNDFLIGCLIAVPAGYILVPLIQKVVDLVTDEEIHPAKKLKIKR